jgi:lysophospholipid acyltransferase (LPLAT)-like uncharacterized protein
MAEQPDPIEQQEDAERISSTGRRLGLRLFGSLSSGLIRLLGATWRLRVLGQDPRQSPQAPSTSPQVHLAALFHESLLASAFAFRNRGYGVVVSRSRDGDLVESTLRSLGFGAAARGSSSKGGSAALLGLLRCIEAGTTVSVLVDGPRGPARVSKSGVIDLARLTGLPIQPVAFSARPAIRIRSWDRSLIPLPFARVVCAFGEPMAVAGDLDEAQVQRAARRLDRCLADLHHQADRLLL